MDAQCNEKIPSYPDVLRVTWREKSKQSANDNLKHKY